MASAGFMFVEGNNQGTIRGDSTVTSQERRDSIQIIELQHEVLVPSDSISGRSSGMRQHRLLRVTAQVDRATPLMYHVMVLNESCDVQLRFWKRNLEQDEVEYFKIVLTGANVASIKMHWPNNLSAETAGLPEQVEYGFTYHTITWTFIEAGIEGTDEWLSERS